MRYFEITLKSFFSIYPAVSTFRGKGSYLETTFKKIVFCPYIRKYQNSKKTFREKWTYFEITLKKSFLPIFSKIWTYLRKRRFLRSFWKKIIFCRYLCKYQHFVVKHVFLYVLVKNRFLFINLWISIFWEKGRGMRSEIFRDRLKKSFLPISPKISKCKENVLFFRYVWTNIYLFINP